MHRSILAFALLLALCATPAAAAGPNCSEYASALRVMVSADQALRSRWQFDQAAPGAAVPHVVQVTDLVDRQNTARLKAFVEACGWPQKSTQGPEAVNDAWLLAQHADRDREFQKRVLQLLQAAVARGEVPGDHLAYLSDRIAVAEGRPQLYGTQLELKGECELEFSALDDTTKVEARRRAIGWPTLEEYKQRVRDNALPARCRSAPRP